MKNKTVVLAFSGGLDTSYCVVYLKEELGLTVHTVTVNTGGFSEHEMKVLEEKAMRLGSARHLPIDKAEDYYQNIVRFLLFGNVLRNNTYPLSVSSERAIQATAVAEYAKRIGADFVAHGSTGAGNDQVRFDLVFHLLVPEIEILTPIRDQNLSRQEEMAYLGSKGIGMIWAKAEYSINKGLWGTSIGGKETLTSHLPFPDHAFPGKTEGQGPLNISFDFEKGEPVALNGEEMKSIDLIRNLDALTEKFGIGRDIHTGDTIVGIKGRVGFQAGAALVLIKAHHALEKHTLTRWQLQLKDQLASWYGMLVHEGQYHEPALRDIEALLASSQRAATGKVFVTLQPYRFTVDGVDSPHDLMQSEFGKYGEASGSWDGNDVRGFSKVLANGLKIYHQVNPSND